jgi:riboflavin transporter FmnP
MKLDYQTILVIAVLLVALSQVLDGVQSPLAPFLHGLLVGLSIACSIIGLLLHGRRSANA